MSKINLRKHAVAAALAAAFTFGTSQAMAAVAPTFVYDLDGVAGGTTITANAVSGSSTETLQITGATTFAGAGWVQFNALTLNGPAQAGSAYSDTGLYATFTLSNHITSGAMGVSGSTYDLDSLNVSIYYDASKNNGFLQGSGAIGAHVVDNGTADVLLGTASLVPGTGSAALSSTFGAPQNALMYFSLNATGENFFINPDPFYSMAFEAFNSTGGDWNFDLATGTLNVNNAVGVVDFIPEPASLLLVGLGLVGVGMSRRRKL